MLSNDNDRQALREPFAGLVASRSRWARLLDGALDLVFPPRCESCGRVDHVWCGRCLHTLEIEPVQTCKRHAEQMAVYSAGKHDGIVAQAIHAFKYQNATTLYQPLAARLARVMADSGLQADCIMPVPLHPRREAERGYNQASLMAWELAQKTGIPARFDLLQRERHTGAQVGLDRAGRLQNVAGAFAAHPDSAGLRVVVVDDVSTSGATLWHCAAALQSAGATHIDGLTVTVADSAAVTDDSLRNSH
ncbi:MAG: ComF family protein [Anaerolineaceae bacterium]|nr:MAG: ComF family protein [Anaerolineaceae bacterium]